MNEIVLIHGAWQGRVVLGPGRSDPRGAGGVVLTPTLTGSGERTAELSPSVTLARHVDDVVAELVDGDRRDGLVGHSYSGWSSRALPSGCRIGWQGWCSSMRSTEPCRIGIGPDAAAVSRPVPPKRRGRR